MHHKKLIFFLANFSFGGAAESVKKLSVDLSKKGFQCKIICLGNCAYKKELRKNSIEVKELNFINAFNAMPKIKEIVKYESKIGNVIFISNINYANVLSLLFLRSINKLKIVLFERTPYEELNFYFNSFSRFIKNIIIKMLIKLLYKKADLVISNNKTTSTKLRSELKIKISTIYSPSIKKIEKFYVKKSKKKLRIIWIGRFSNEKSFLTLVRAIYRVRRLNLRVNVLADGSKKNEYLKMIKSLGLKEKFLFQGNVKDVNKYLRESDLFINTSFYEGFPNSVLQAINFGLPVIASRSYGGINEILLNGKFGTLFKIDDEIDLAKKIIDFYNDNTKFIRKAKLAHASLKKYEFKNLHNKFSEILKKI